MPRPYRHHVRLRADRNRTRHPRPRQGPRRRHHADGGHPRAGRSRRRARGRARPLTHEKSPVGCAAALATLDVIAEEQLLTAARVLGAHALDRLQSMAQRYPLISEVRGAGLYLGVEIGRRDARDANARAERLLYRCLEAGLSFKLGGGNVVTLCPPLTITRDELDQALDILEGSMAGL
ncbi:hypothetical protein C2U70_20080 [Bradyrhizobium guangdongense]|nr:hypothetical protein C2U70_20080 [Bradyrhizobium guangdongense]